jgi:ferredoxin
MTFPITIDGARVEVSLDQTVLSAARTLGLDIPTLCYLEKCGPLNSCLVCVVKINGKLVPSCGTKVQPDMVVESETEEVHEARRTALELLFSDHVGDCLSPCNRLCPLGLNIPVMIRQIQAGKLVEATSTVRGALPLAGVLGRLCHHPCEQGCRRGSWDDPAAIRDMERFVTDWQLQKSLPEGTSSCESPSIRFGVSHSDGEPLKSGNLTGLITSPPKSGTPNLQPKPASGKSVAIVGAGPTGLAAAYYLARAGHGVTVVDRNPSPGGTLRSVSEEQLPSAILAAETDLLSAAGVEFKLGVALGVDVTIDGLSRGFDAILLTIGELAPGEAEKLELPGAANALKADPNTCQTPLPKVFAAGAVVKPVKQLVRAMAEGRAAAECVNRFLSGQQVRRPEKIFSSIMGRLDSGELRQFLATASPGGCVTPCDRCGGFSPPEAATEAARCLHCDCRSSGNCLLQHYAQVYGAEAGRFRGERRPFEQHLQPGGIIFEPGKCILCGICVKLTELAREPLGLTFIGRGFDVRIGAPMNHTIEEGLREVAAECVRQCPTGALAWGEMLKQPNWGTPDR